MCAGGCWSWWRWEACCAYTVASSIKEGGAVHAHYLDSLSLTWLPIASSSVLKVSIFHKDDYCEQKGDGDGATKKNAI